MQGILDKISYEKPSNPLENFEKYSQQLKRTYIRKDDNFERIFVDNIDRNNCQRNLKIYKVNHTWRLLPFMSLKYLPSVLAKILFLFFIIFSSHYCIDYWFRRFGLYNRRIKIIYLYGSFIINAN